MKTELEWLRLALAEDLGAQWSAFVLGRCYAAFSALMENPSYTPLHGELRRLRDMCAKQESRDPVEVRLEVLTELTQLLTRTAGEA